MTRAEAERRVIDLVREHKTLSELFETRDKLRAATTELDALPTDDGWRPGETAPKEPIEQTDGSHRYGPRFLGNVWGRVQVCRWWEADSGASNFLNDGGNAVQVSEWMPLPSPPDDGGRG